MERIMTDCLNIPIATSIGVAYQSFVDCKPQAACPPATKKKGKTMSRYYDEDMDCYVERASSDASEQRQYFLNRISQISLDKWNELRVTFGLEDDKSPETPTELVKRITDGMYVITKEYADKKVYDPVRYISWRNPATVKDVDGFDAALVEKDKAQSQAKDAVMAFSADKALEAVQAFQAWTPTPTSTAS